MKSELQLGQAANLLLGLHPKWADTARGGTPFFAPPEQPLITSDIGTDADGVAEWGEPTLSLHDDVEGLVDEIFDYWVRPFRSDPGGFRLPASTLMLAHEDRDRTLASLGETLGIDLRPDPDAGYMLLKMRRAVADQTHDADQLTTGRRFRVPEQWTREGRNAMGRLRVAARVREGSYHHAVVSTRGAARFVDYFYAFGTHFLSRVELGDQIFQVYTCRPARYRHMKENLVRETGDTRVSGSLAFSFRRYTGQDWVSSRGKIVSASCDPALAETLGAGEWHDAEFANGDSILALSDGEQVASREFCSQFDKIVPVTLGFAPQNVLMDVFRCNGWRRLLKAALLQRYGDSVQIPVGRGLLLAGGELFPDGPEFPAIAAPSTQIIQDRLEAADCQFVNGEIVESLVASSLMLTANQSPPAPLPGKRVAIWAYQTDARGGDGRVPVLTLEDDAFASYEFITGKMRGALFVSDRSGVRRETIFEGFRFATGEEFGESGRHRVILRGDVQMPSRELVRDLGSFLWSSLDLAESILVAPPASRPGSVSFARTYVGWLAMILGGGDEWPALHLRALYLSRRVGCLSPPKAQARFAAPDLRPEEVAELAAAAASVGQLLPQVRMQIMGRRYSELEITAPAAADLNESDQIFSEAATDLEAAGDRLESALAVVRFRYADLAAPISASLGALNTRIESARNHVATIIDEIASDFAGSAAAPLAREILEALSGLLSPETSRPEPQGATRGGGPICEFWQSISNLGQAIVDTTAIELLGDHHDAESLDHARSLLSARDGAAGLPSPEEWHRLPALVAQLLGPSLKVCQKETLESALQSLVAIGDDWLTTRMVRAQLNIDRDALSLCGETIANSSPSGDSLCQKWRLLRLLAHASELLEATAQLRATG